MRFLLLALACCLLASDTLAQLSLQSSLSNDFDAVLANPAIQPSFSSVVRIGAVHLDGTTNTALQDLGQEVDGDLRLSAVKASRLTEDVLLSGQYRAQTLGVNIRRGKHQFGAHHAVRVELYGNLPNALVQLAIQGNEPLAGSALQVLPKGEVTLYHEVGLHYAQQLNPKLALGGRVKLLAASANISQLTGSAQVTTAANDYQLTYALDASLRTAGLDFNLSEEQYEFDFDYSTIDAGLGAGLDLGVVWRPRRRWEIALAMSDLGAIFLSDRAREHRATGVGTYAGVEGNVFAEGYEFNLETAIDGLRDEAGLSSEPLDYTHQLSPKLAAHLRHRVSDATDLTLSATYDSHELGRRGATVGIAQRIGSDFHLAAHVGVVGDALIYGGRLEVGLGPVGVVVYSDHIPTLTSLYQQRSAQVGAGLTLRFGRIRAQARQAWFDEEPGGGVTTPDNYL